ncbi:hypothetical protein [Amycolatopsis sp. H20-H5]|uniref:hypothetical protein n=1 Tax=Amycolatopsis sp. H20-H5 TaxID=3046309 RepID=UPI002DBDE2F3|nr:hypothetical protein [Amycolatopsis sp. H20-H5]MEC3974529.1 hypothetical protein [Amycolatopsis sp. H20-H5]
MPAPRWKTLDTRRTVLAVVHNVTAATRLLDVLAVYAGDPRVETVFTCPGSSAFTAGTTEFLAARGVRLIPWRQAVSTRFELAIAASYGGDLHEIRAPLTVIPHGMGYNKYLETGNRKPETGNRKPETGNRKPETVFGLSIPWLMHKGEVVPASIVLSHEEQLDRLRQSCPQAAERAVVAGDPCLDRMQASRSLRETYRQAFGLEPHQRLIVLSSTWGKQSLVGTGLELIRRLADELPWDSYRLALAPHPNIAHGHSGWQLKMWLADCVKAGVLVLPSEELWQPALVAADLTIGDHGSVTFYSAALETPILLAATPAGTVDPGSPIGLLLDAAPRLDLARPLRPQVDRTIAEHDPDALTPITNLATSLPGKSAEVLRSLVYETLDLTPPPGPAVVRTLPVPALTHTAPTTQFVRVTGTTVDRRAADLTGIPPAGTHLVIDTAEPDASLLSLAAVLVHRTARDASRWITETLRALPGCALAAARITDTTWLFGTTTGRLVRLDDITGAPEAFASLLYVRLELSGERLPGELDLQLGETTHTATATVLITAPPAAPRGRQPHP